MDRSDHDSGDMPKTAPEAESGAQAHQGKLDHKAERAQRLAAALRQNLRRRKLPKATVRPVDERN